MYGTLSQGMKSSSLLPLPPPPYTSLNIGSTLQKLRAVKGVDYYWHKPDSISQTPVGLFGNRPPDSIGQTPVGLFGSRPPSKPNPSFVTDNSRLVEKIPTNLERDKCRIEHHLKGLLDTTEGKIEGLKLSNYLTT